MAERYCRASGCADDSVTNCQFSFNLEKRGRKKKAPLSPPQLLVQDSETTGRQIEDRVAQLFVEEEVELSSTPPLPASRLLKEELGKASRCLQPPEGKQNFLWEGSALTGAWALESFYTASLVPPVAPQESAKVCPPLQTHVAGLWVVRGGFGSSRIIALGINSWGTESSRRRGRERRKPEGVSHRVFLLAVTRWLSW